MATQEETMMILHQLEKVHPIHFFRCVNETNAGIGAVLRFLHETEGTVTAGKISAFMGVSTARVAVLLKKMEQKDLIIKESAENDARVTVVRLSPHGEKTIEQMREEMFAQVSHVIDVVGMKRMLEFIAISAEIESAVKGPPFDF